jgi:predicted PurR-regulated permease PerM
MSDEPTSTPEHATEADEAELRLPPWPWIWKLLGSIAVTWLSALLFLAFFRKVRDLLIWAVIALFASFALEPAVDWLAKRGWRRGLATFLLLFGLAVVMVLMVALMIPLLVEQVQALIKAAPGILESVSTFTKRWFGIEVSVNTLSDQLTNANSAVSTFAKNIAGNVFGVASSVLGTIFKLLTIALFTFYLTADGPRFRRTICSYVPQRHQETVLWTWEVAIEKTGAYLYSRLLLAIFSGVATFFVLTALGVPFAVPLAVWMGLVSQFIPTIGTYIAMALPLLVAVVQGPSDALILLIFFTAYQQLENYVLSPRITAKTMELHPALAFAFAIAGASISGIVGAFLALPIAAIVQAVGSTYIHRHDVAETDLTRVQTPEESRRIREGRKRDRSSLLPWARGVDRSDAGGQPDDEGHDADDGAGDDPDRRDA